MAALTEVYGDPPARCVLDPGEGLRQLGRSLAQRALQSRPGPGSGAEEAGAGAHGVRDACGRLHYVQHVGEGGRLQHPVQGQGVLRDSVGSGILMC